MVQRIIVRTVKDAWPGTTIDAVRRIGFCTIIPAACIIIAVVMANDDNRPSRETAAAAGVPDHPAVVVVAAAVVAILAVLSLLLLLLWRRQQRRHVVGFAVSFYGEGVHLENVVEVPSCRPVSTKTTNTTTNNYYESTRFIGYGEIKDCVVTEIILVHTVENAVVLRLLHPHDNNNDNVLAQPHPPVDVFPRARLTYAECLRLREEINQVLKQKKKRPTTG
jgi:hypothetical protein